MKKTEGRKSRDKKQFYILDMLPSGGFYFVHFLQRTVITRAQMNGTYSVQMNLSNEIKHGHTNLVRYFL
jgi:hypothetical protein